ncbi:uncharacterized protein CIMG_13540 [Coccidioides immitis RS]|uniref:Uncharacterized protein n=1 Tax=Coccidioides immitis (strain RS) TaxID=246410 RepID=A0A0D8JYC4_COCIM|nr:uncharacterized protein CIMG_13540 [Coccidioides immitis RS]KJF61253.1 hypothetical protein CIMG_13540 [Coccidioides immitis RS]
MAQERFHTQNKSPALAFLLRHSGPVMVHIFHGSFSCLLKLSLKLSTYFYRIVTLPGDICIVCIVASNPFGVSGIRHSLHMAGRSMTSRSCNHQPCHQIRSSPALSPAARGPVISTMKATISPISQGLNMDVPPASGLLQMSAGAALTWRRRRVTFSSSLPGRFSLPG